MRKFVLKTASAQFFCVAFSFAYDLNNSFKIRSKPNPKIGRAPDFAKMFELLGFKLLYEILNLGQLRDPKMFV
jgi:hypothetical protein